MWLYVDESGDEGTDGRGSKWLVFGAAAGIGSTADLAALVAAAGKKISRGGPRLPHFTDMTHRDKIGVLDLYQQGQWEALVVASDTSRIRPGSYLRRPNYQYNYALRHLLERASQHAAQAHEQLAVVIESRRNFDLADFQRYIGMLRGRSDPHFDWGAFDEARISVSQKTNEPLLCVADGVAHAMFKALEPDPEWGHYEMAYAERVRPKLWRGPNADTLLDNGLTLMPISAEAAFRVQYPWITEWAVG